ncbi:hypothetical protein MMC17_006812 [Xylographa soralifera]|nr:hypothetical protein [Xylographa soralifera]
MEHNSLPLDNDSSSHAVLIPTQDRGGKPYKPVLTCPFTLPHISRTDAVFHTENLVNSILKTHQKILVSPTHLAILFRFSDRLAQLQAQLTAYATSVTRYVRAHPGEIVFALFCMICLAAVPVILPAIGFSSIGPVAGGLAAAWQSAIGAVVAGSPFAILQSAAMGGVAGVLVTGVGVAGIAGLAAKKGWETDVGTVGKEGKGGE